jgi:HAD superfamily hydrolase (TIGR01490 family)
LIDPSPIAVFDFDGTLTRRDSLLPFLMRLVGPWLPLRALRALPALAGHSIGMVPNWKAKEDLFHAVLRGTGEADLNAVGARFAGEVIPRLLRPRAMERIREHQDKGDLVVLVSASLEAYLKPWGDANGFDVVAGTRLEVRDGVLTGRLEGANCWGLEKVARLRAAIGDVGGRHLTVYGDGEGDRELLRMATVARYRSLAPTI